MSQSLRLPATSRVRGGLCAATLACTLLTGCSAVSHVIADNWPHLLGGMPPGVPPRDQAPPPVPAVHEMPPPRDSARMTPEERKQYEEELRATRSEAVTQGEETRSAAPGR